MVDESEDAVATTPAQRPLSSDEAWDLADVIGATYVEVANAAGDAARPHGLTLGELVALAVLAQHPEGLSQSEWGRLQGVTRQRAHVVTRTMSERGLVTVEHQGRGSVVRFTASGRNTSLRLRKTVGLAIAEMMGAAPPDEWRAAGRQLADLLTALRRHAEESTDGAP